MSRYHRIINPLKSKSFFLFGARAVGKTHFLRQDFKQDNTLWIDLLDPKLEAQLMDNPSHLKQMITGSTKKLDWVVIDEVQKAPKLLDVVHQQIEEKKIKFALTGSSARKLKRGGANLLAGRALMNEMFPLTYKEIGTDFQLLDVLTWGALPTVITERDQLTKTEYLESYVQTYLKEEILQEQIIRNLTPFRKFLSIAAQSNGTLLNLKKIALDLSVDWSTVRTYFEILEDTLLGFRLPTYAESIRKQQLKASKFYLFDIGVKRVLDRTITLKPTTGQQIGPLFEHFIICEIYRLNSYHRKKFALSHIVTKGGLEIDLVIERPGEKTALVEIKSSDQVTDHHIRHLEKLSEDYPDRFELICLCRESYPRMVGKVHVLPWQLGFEKLGL